MNLDKFKSEEFTAFYDKTKLELSAIESEFLKLEKEYFKLTPLYENIFNHIQRMSKDCEENKATLLKYRIDGLYREFMRFHHTAGYNVEAFHQLFGYLKNISNKLSNEIFSESAVKIIREKIRIEAKNWIPDGLPSKSSMHKYLAVKIDEMTFLVPFKKKLWEKKVESRKKLKIQIKSIPGDNIFPFESLLSYTSKSYKKEKLAVLLELENGKKTGILTDEIEGVMIFSDKFIRKYKEYFPVGEGNFQPFVKLKGQRYFLRIPDEKNQR